MASLKPIKTQYVGIQEGYGRVPTLPLYTILEPMGEHPNLSTVTIRTLERHGRRPVECKVYKMQGENLLGA